MRIDQIASYVKLSRTQTIAGFQSSRGLSSAQHANQARLSDAAKGFVQATRVRDGVAAEGTGIGKVQALLKKAQDPALSAADRSSLQADFTKALAAVEQGGKDQAAAVADKTLANGSYDPKRNRTGTAADLASLAKLDLGSATPDQLAEAAKALDTARSQTDVRLASADREVDGIARRTDRLEGVQSALDGTTTPTAKQQGQVDLITAMLRQQGAQVVPGSIYSSIV